MEAISASRASHAESSSGTNGSKRAGFSGSGATAGKAGRGRGSGILEAAEISPKKSKSVEAASARVRIAAQK